MRRLPPLAAIRVFEAAARHGNFTRAAQELGMTQAAVSYQMKLLEERVGTPLFARSGRGIMLTETGRRIAPSVSAAFDMIDQSFAEMRAEDESMIVVSTSELFANAWLAWRLGGFQMANPGIAVRLEANNAIADFTHGDIDIAIRVGEGRWHGLLAEKLLDLDFTPMCSPGFLRRHGGAITPEDMLKTALISPHDRWWSRWLAVFGLRMTDEALRRGIRHDSQPNEATAAMAGQGIAMLTPFFFRNDVAAGRLVRLSERTATEGKAYWLIYPEYRRNTAKIRRFRDWIMAEIGINRLPIPPSERP